MKNVYFLWALLFPILLLSQGPATTEKYITVDQFGYRPYDRKVAVIVDPQSGFNADDSFVPGQTYQVRRWNDNSVAFNGTVPLAYNGGATEVKSGDRGWWYDFSPLTEVGDFYIYDVDNAVGSYKFHIGDDVYEDVLRKAMRFFYHQRIGTNRPATYAGTWAFPEQLYPQDTSVKNFYAQSNTDQNRDMSGGWMDAGDPNKYVTFATGVVHQLLSSYEQNTSMWNNLDLNIPESNNNIPDILDEIKWELDWLIKMQDTNDGGVYIKMGDATTTGGSEDFNSGSERFYGNKCSSSSLALASMFAHAYLVMKDIPALQAYANQLRTKADLAWDYFDTVIDGAIETECDIQTVTPYICCGDADGFGDSQVAIQHGDAALYGIYLFAATGEQQYQDAFLAHYNLSFPFSGQGRESQLGREYPYINDAFSFYIGLSGANNAAKQTILSAQLNSTNNTTYFSQETSGPNSSLYRAHNNDLTWGSNRDISILGGSSYNYYKSNINPSKSANLNLRAKNALHYLHGINPFSMVYLSNMQNATYESEFSAAEIYHAQFPDNSDFDNYLTGTGPAPGYLVGGANPLFEEFSGSSGNLKVKIANVEYDELVQNQPDYKIYSEHNWTYIEALGVSGVWALSEPAIYYQSAYVNLLANFVGRSSQNDNGDAIGIQNFLGTTFQDQMIPGDTYTFEVSYSSNSNADIKISLINTNNNNEVIASSPVSVNANSSGNISLDLTVPNGTPLGNNYELSLTLFNGSGTIEESESATRIVDEIVNIENSLIAQVPLNLIAGNTYEISMDYGINVSGEIFLGFFDTNDWSEVVDFDKIELEAGDEGNTTLSFTVPSGTSSGDNYAIILSLNGAGDVVLVSLDELTVNVSDNLNTNNSLNTTLPASVGPGETLDVNVDYSAAQNGSLFFALFATDTSTGVYEVVGSAFDQKQVFIGDDRSVTMSITIPENTPTGANYALLVNLVNDAGEAVLTVEQTPVGVSNGNTPQNSLNINGVPSQVDPGTSYSFDATYSSVAAGSLFAGLYDTNDSLVGSGTSQPIAAGGSGTVSLNLTVPNGTAPGTGYSVRVFLRDGAGNDLLEESQGIEVVDNNGGNSINANFPAQILPGEVYTLDINYTSTTDGSIFLSVQEAGLGAYGPPLGGTGYATVSAGTGTVSLPFSTPFDQALGNYEFYLDLTDDQGIPVVVVLEPVAIVDQLGQQSSLSANLTNSLDADSSYSTVLTYSVTEAGQLQLGLYEKDTLLSNLASTIVVAGSSGDETLTINIPAGTAAGSNYTLVAELLDASGNNALAPNVTQNNVTINNGSSGPTYYYIKNKESQEYLAPEVADNFFESTAKDNSDRFKWEKIPTSNGYFYLKNKWNGAYIQPGANGVGDLCPQSLVTDDSTQWKDNISSDGTYVHLLNRQNQTYLNLINASGFPFMNTVPTSNTGDLARWTFEVVSGSGKGNSENPNITETKQGTTIVYPNPVKGSVHIATNTNAAFYQIFDLTGREMKSGELRSSRITEIDLSMLSTGTYVLSVGENRFKIVKE